MAKKPRLQQQTRIPEEKRKLVGRREKCITESTAEPQSSEVSSHEDNEEELQTETAEDVTASGRESEEVSGTASRGITSMIPLR